MCVWGGGGGGGGVPGIGLEVKPWISFSIYYGIGWIWSLIHIVSASLAELGFKSVHVVAWIIYWIYIYLDTMFTVKFAWPLQMLSV